MSGCLCKEEENTLCFSIIEVGVGFDCNKKKQGYVQLSKHDNIIFHRYLYIEFGIVYMTNFPLSLPLRCHACTIHTHPNSTLIKILFIDGCGENSPKKVVCLLSLHV